MVTQVSAPAGVELTVKVGTGMTYVLPESVIVSPQYETAVTRPLLP